MTVVEVALVRHGVVADRSLLVVKSASDSYHILKTLVVYD